MEMGPVYFFGGVAIVWVLLYWRILVLRKQIIDTLKLRHAHVYETITQPIRSARPLDRIFATSEVVRAQWKHEAVLLGKETPRDAGVRALQKQYRRWIGYLVGWSLVFIGGMLLVVWVKTR